MRPELPYLRTGRRRASRCETATMRGARACGDRSACASIATPTRISLPYATVLHTHISQIVRDREILAEVLGKLGIHVEHVEQIVTQNLHTGISMGDPFSLQLDTVISTVLTLCRSQYVSARTMNADLPTSSYSNGFSPKMSS